MDVAAVRQAICDTLVSLNDLHFYATVPDVPNVPALIVYPDNIQYVETFAGDAANPSFGGACRATFILHILSSSVSTRGGQERLDAYLDSSGAHSVVAMIDDDSTLGGEVMLAEVVELRQYGTVELQDGGTRYYSAQLVLNVLAER